MQGLLSLNVVYEVDSLWDHSRRSANQPQVLRSALIIWWPEVGMWEFPNLGGSSFASFGDDQLEERSLHRIATVCVVHPKP